MMCFWKNLGSVFIAAVFMSSCAVHSYFPFICFQRGCVQQQFNLKGVKKRMKAKLVVMERKRNKRRQTNSKTDYGRSSSPSGKNKDADTLAVLRETRVDYYRYLLFFRVQRCANCFDTLLVEHSSEYRTLIETDQSRLINMIDTIHLKNIVTVYIGKSHPKKEDLNFEYEERHRQKAIRKFLEKNGIKSNRIKVLGDSLSPPRL